MLTIRVRRLRPEARLPHYAHSDSFGDLAADLYAAESVLLSPAGQPGSTQAVPTGLALEFPSTHGALIEDRSGLALKGVTTLAGVIDPGFRGEIRIVVTNLSPQPVQLESGDRIAQLRLVQRIHGHFVEVEELETAARGERGFGSTGA